MMSDSSFTISLKLDFRPSWYSNWSSLMILSLMSSATLHASTKRLSRKIKKLHFVKSKKKKRNFFRFIFRVIIYLKTSLSSLTFLLPDELDLLSSRNALAYAMGPAFTCRGGKKGVRNCWAVICPLSEQSLCMLTMIDVCLNKTENCKCFWVTK